MSRGLSAYALGVALLCDAATPAARGQVIGAVVGNIIAEQNEERCLSGEPISAGEVAEARDPAIAFMARYWQAVRPGQAADIAPLFHDSGKSVWRADGASATGAGLHAVTDRMAATAVLDAAPSSFVRSGDSGGARGVWTARDRSGAAVASYLVELKRSLGVWRLRSVERLAAGATVPGITQYCHKPGDVEAHGADLAAAEARRAAKKARKAAERGATARSAAERSAPDGG